VALRANTAAWTSCKSQDLRRVAEVYRGFLGGRYPVVYVGDGGRPQLDVITDVVGYSISLDPECVIPAPFLDATA
jgi:hypothetical protein